MGDSKKGCISLRYSLFFDVWWILFFQNHFGCRHVFTRNDAHDVYAFRISCDVDCAVVAEASHNGASHIEHVNTVVGTVDVEDACRRVRVHAV